jgi:hypothetical protein
LRSLLSDELRKYYTRKGNRLLFVNKMTLNQLALAMWEKLGFQGIDASVLSRVVSGERTFTPRQADVFCKITSLSKTDTLRIKEATFLELASRFGIQEDFFRKRQKNFSDIVQINIDQIHTIRMKDEPTIAEEWADEILEKLNNEICLETDNNRRTILIEQEGQLMIEKMHASLATSKFKDIVKKGNEISAALEEIAAVSKNVRFYEESLLNLGAINYLTLEYQKTILPLEKVVLMNVPESRKALSLRMIMLSSAYTHNLDIFHKAKTTLIKNVAYYDQSLLCEIFEGLARSSAILGNKIEAGNFLDKSWRYLNELEKNNGEGVIFRKLQLIRTEIEIFKILGIRRESEIERLGLEGLEIARKYKYNRYETTIKNKLDSVLNTNNSNR